MPEANDNSVWLKYLDQGSTATRPTAKPAENDNSVWLKYLEQSAPETGNPIVEFGKNIGRKTSIGLVGRAAGAFDAPTDQGYIANLASELISFGIDPLTWGTGVVGRIAGEGVALKLSEYALEKGFLTEALPKVAAGATQLAGITAVKDPLEQVATTGTVDPLQTLKRTAQSAVVGGAMGPAMTIENPLLRAGGEAASMAVAQPLVEGRLPEGQDALNAAAMIGGFKLSDAIIGKLAKLAGRDKPPSRKEFAEAAEIKAGHVPVAAKREVIVDYAAQWQAGMDLSNRQPVVDESQPKITDSELAALQAENDAQIAKGQTNEVSPNEVVPNEGRDNDAQVRQGQTPGQEVPAKAEEAQVPPVLTGEASGELRVTGIKNAIVEQQQADMGLPPIQKPPSITNEDTFNSARERLERNPLAADELVRSLRTNPRPIGVEDEALLLAAKIPLEARLDDVLRRKVKANKADDAEAVVLLDSEIIEAKNKIAEINHHTEGGGKGIAQALQFRRTMVDQDYSFVRLTLEKEAAKSQSLGKEELNKAEETAAKAAAWDKYQVDKATAEANKSADDAILDLKAEVRKEAPKRRAKRSAQAQANFDAALKDFFVAGGGNLFSIEATIKALPEALRLARAGIELGIARFADFYDAVKAKIGEEKAKKAGEHLAAAWKQVREEAKPVRTKPIESKNQLRKFARDLAKHFVEDGIETREKMVDAVHAELKKVVPTISRDESMHAISGYGNYTPPTKDEIKKQLAEWSGELQKIGKLQDMAAGQAGKRSGVGRLLPTGEARRLEQQVGELKKKGGLKVTDPETQLRTIENEIEARLTNQIDDLETQIKSGKKTIDERAPVTATNEKIEALRKQRDALREVYDEMFRAKRGLSDEQRIVNAIKAAERSGASYEKMLESGNLETPAKRETPLTSHLVTVRAWRDTMKAKVEELRNLANPKATPEQRALASYKKRTLARIADYQERLEKGDFAKRERTPTPLDGAGEKIRREAEIAKVEWQRGLAADERSKWGTGKKIWEGIKESLNLSRSAMTSMDFSAVGRQGGMLALSHPLLAKGAMAKMFQAAKSEASFSRFLYEIGQRPNAELYRLAKLSLTGVHGSLTNMEEAFMSRLAHYIPGIAGSERAYVMFLDQLRADTFDTMIATLGKGGRVSTAEAKVIANYINVATGRGDLGRFQAAAQGLATAFFAPRYIISRFQLLFGQPLFREGNTWRTRKLIAQEYARSIAGLGAFYTTAAVALTAMLGPPDKDKEWGIELDPRSSDFGKIRIGKTRIDPLMGLQQVTVLGSRLVSGETKNLKGQIIPIRGPKVPYGGADAVDVTTRFLRTKLSPLLAVGADVASGKDVVGQPVTLGGAVAGITAPISMRDIYGTMKEQGIPGGTALALLNVFGVSVSTYQDKNNPNAANDLRRKLGLPPLP